MNIKEHIQQQSELINKLKQPNLDLEAKEFSAKNLALATKTMYKRGKTEGLINGLGTAAAIFILLKYLNII